MSRYHSQGQLDQDTLLHSKKCVKVFIMSNTQCTLYTAKFRDLSTAWVCIIAGRNAHALNPTTKSTYEDWPLGITYLRMSYASPWHG